MSNTDNQQQQEPNKTKEILNLILIPIKAQWTAWRRRDRISLIVLALAGTLSFLNLFMGMKDTIIWTALVLLAGLFLWIAYKRTEALKAEGISKRDLNIVYASAAALAFPIAYAELLIVSFAAAIAFIVVLFAILGFVANMFFNSKNSRSSGTSVADRGANSHINTNGDAKLEYRTLNDAKGAAAKYEKDFKEKMNVYMCAKGGHYHIGHANDAQS